MPEPWEAEVRIDAALASRAIARQFPALAGAVVAPLGEGWDNAAFLVGGRYVFRFPRRAMAVALIETEQRVLASIAAHVPLPIPVPLFGGKPNDEYPWPFAGYALLRGQPLTSVRLDDGAYESLALASGRFLRALHAIDAAPLRAAGLGTDQIGRLDHARCMPKVSRRLRELSAAGLLGDVAPLERLLEDVAPEGQRNHRLAVVHGDLYARHILVGDDAQAAGIIDWGDVHFGDPAVDLAVAFEVLPPSTRDVFADAYGKIDPQAWKAARYRGVYHAAMVAHYGHRIGDADMLRAGLAGLSSCEV
jgi:aminoglycoside phosphotransferase (APT) family kinase protein